MRVILFFTLVMLPMLSQGQSIMDILKRSGELYDEGTKYFTEKEYMIADSLYAESLKLYPHPDTYYNRAVARKHLGDMSGFAQNLEYAMYLGDTAARKLYYRQCVVADTFYLSKDNKKASVFDFHRGIIFRKSKYTPYQEVHRFAPSGEIDLQYVIRNRDTVYYVIPNADSIAFKSVQFFNHLKENLKYPAILKKDGIYGRVWVNFSVDQEGNIKDITVVRSNALAFSVETITAIEKTGKFPVIYHEGKPVKMKLLLPVKFHPG